MITKKKAKEKQSVFITNNSFYYFCALYIRKKLKETQVLVSVIRETIP